VLDVNQKRGGLRKQDGVNFDWRRSMGSCARRAGELRAHSNWRRLKEGWLKVGVNLSRSLPKGIKI
jgi:hypothetical protein